MSGGRNRGVVFLVLASLVLGVFTLSPVSAHFTTNTTHLGKHAWQQFIKQKVYTKQQANRRFQNHCKPGAVLAYGAVDVSEVTANLSTDGLVERFNCVRQNNLIRVRKDGTGVFQVAIPGITNQTGQRIVVANASQPTCFFVCVPLTDTLITYSVDEAPGGVKVIEFGVNDVEQNADGAERNVGLRTDLDFSFVVFR